MFCVIPPHQCLKKLSEILKTGREKKKKKQQQKQHYD